MTRGTNVVYGGHIIEGGGRMATGAAQEKVMTTGADLVRDHARVRQMVSESESLTVLLNATSEELECVGGDYSLYRNWLRLTSDGLRFQLVPHHPVRHQHLFWRKVAEKLCFRKQPEALRRALFIASRFIYVPREAVAKADVVLSHILFPRLPTSSYPPIIWSTQGLSPAVYYERYSGRRWTMEDVVALFRVLGRRANALLISTQTCARNLVAWCPELEGKIFLAPAPVFSTEMNPRTKPSFRDGVIRLLFVGMDARLKGLPEVVQAYCVLVSRYPRIQLDIVSRPARDLRKQIEALPGTRLWPRLSQQEVMALMAQADIFVLPTYADTYALSAVEAMAEGCAIIISDLDPLPEICPPGEVGLAVTAGDVRGLIEKIDALVSGPDRLRQFQVNARRRYERVHHPTIVVDRLRYVMESVRNGRRASLHRR